MSNMIGGCVAIKDIKMGEQVTIFIDWKGRLSMQKTTSEDLDAVPPVCVGGDALLRCISDFAQHIEISKEMTDEELLIKWKPIINLAYKHTTAPLTPEELSALTAQQTETMRGNGVRQSIKDAVAEIGKIDNKPEYEAERIGDLTILHKKEKP